MFNKLGFTLIELIMVIVLLGIIAVYAAPRLGSVPAQQAGAFTSKLRADIRYAQNLAMTKNKRSRIYFNGTVSAPPQGYAIVQDNSALNNCSSFAATIDPAKLGNLFTITLNAGAYSEITIVPTVSCLEFDFFGRPYDCSANPLSCSSTPAGMSIAVQGSGVVVNTVTIVNQSGAIN
ncbi:MAG: prepilin-type N-terminal cleavage/methylation domain-containing protein [Nitrospirota bacterium]